MLSRIRQNLLYITLYAFVLLIPVSALHAQLASGTLRGLVTDPSGSAVTGAKVTVRRPDGNSSETITGHDGRFEIKELPPGKCVVEVTAKGFAPFEVLDYEIAAGRATNLDVTLSLAVQKERVIVESTSPTVEVSPEQNAGAIVMTQKDLDALADDPDELQSDLEALAGPSAGPNGGQIYIDGFTGGQLPPKSAIREIRINQNPFSAEYDKLGYGRIEIFTKPGMDQLHGELRLSGNDASFNSRNPFAASEPGYNSELFSGNVGGPLNKKASFFLSAQYRNINDVSVVNAQVLDPSFHPVPFNESIASPRTRVNLSPRIDVQVTPNNTLSVRYQYYRDDLSNQGVGGFDLDSEAFDSLDTEHTLQISDTQVFGTRIVNETRFQFIHSPFDQTPADEADATILVPGAFQGGGSSAGTIRQALNHYELQNYTQIALAKHTIKFGARLREVTEDSRETSGFNGTFYFSSLAAYQSALQGTGGMPTQFAITVGALQTSDSMFDGGFYVSDDWKVRPNITLSGGLRLETQTGMRDHVDWAPRLAVAWGLGHGKSGPRTVIRAGTGIFYERFPEELLFQARRLNGTHQAQCVYSDPTFFPNVPVVSTPGMCPGMATAVLPTEYRISRRLHAPGVFQTAVVLERQLNRVTSLSLTYLNSRGFDQLLTNNINTPLPGTFPTAPVYPLGAPGNVYQYQSEGVFRQQQLFVQVTVRAGTRLTLFSNYILNYAKSDTSGAGSFPSNPFDLQQDYGRASFDYRNRLYMGGSLGLPHGFRVAPFLVVTSGQPYSITLSQDFVGSSQFNQRPAFASAASLPQNVVMTKYGAFDTVPEPGETLVPINSLDGPARFSLHLTVSKTWGFGRPREGSGEAASGGGGGGPRGGPGGGRGGYRGMFGAPTGKRYNLTLSAHARNVFNHTNLSTPTAVLNPPSDTTPVATESPFFARSNQLAGGPFSSQSSSRQVYLQLAFSF